MEKAVDVLLDDSDPFTVTGVMMQSYFICDREVWFIDRGVEIDRENEHIVRGTLVDENTYQSNSDTLYFGPIAPDMMDDGRIVEVKPSKAFDEGSRMQLVYYLWYLKKTRGIKIEGVLAYPKQRDRENVELTSEFESKVEDAIGGIYEIVNRDQPPKLEEKPHCQTCAYQDLCWMGKNV